MTAGKQLPLVNVQLLWAAQSNLDVLLLGLWAKCCAMKTRIPAQILSDWWKTELVVCPECLQGEVKIFQYIASSVAGLTHHHSVQPSCCLSCKPSFGEQHCTSSVRCGAFFRHHYCITQNVCAQLRALI